MRRAELVRAVALGLGLGAATVVGCSGWDPRSPFEHNSPEVDEGLRLLEAGRTQPAEELLERYLGTGSCSADAGLGLPPAIRQKPSGTFDLGLTLFSLGEQFGQRFGEEERSDGGTPREQQLAQRRATEVGCALLVVRAIAADPTVPTELRARAYYLAGNLEFLLEKYEDAVKEYDQALGLVPGLHAEAGDGIGRDAAWNRSIALRRQEDQKDAGPDSSDASDEPDSPDGSDGQDASDGSDGNDGSSGNDGGDKGGNDGGGKDGGDKEDAGKDGGDKEDGGASPEQPPPQPASSQSSSPQQDSRMLEQLEQAPSYQGQEAKQRANSRQRRPTMEDK
jgi:hypothetical protein